MSHGAGQEGTQHDYQEVLELGVDYTALETTNGTGTAPFPLQDYTEIAAEMYLIVHFKIKDLVFIL